MATPIAVFPNSVVTDAQLKVANNLIQTTLKVGIDNANTILFVASTAGFVPNCLVSIDKEILSIASVTPGPNPQLVVATGGRGFDATTAAPHAAGAKVSMFIDAWHHNALSQEIQAIEEWLLGGSGHQVNTCDFNFGAQSPGGSLSAGANVITLAPVPQGVNGTDSNHWLYISGGIGAPEAVLITGGTAVSGAPSGTLFFTAANAHSGAWMIKSATAGIQEAIVAATAATNARVQVCNGVNLLYSKITLPSNMTLIGGGMGVTTIKAANNSASQAFFNIAGGGHYTLVQLDNTSRTTVVGFTIDCNQANNNWTAYGLGGVIGTLMSFDRISSIEFINLPIGYSVGGGSPAGGIAMYSSHDNLIDHCRLLGLPVSVQVQGASGFFSTVGYNNQFILNYLSNMADAGLTSSFSTGDLFFGNVIDGTNGAYQGGIAAIIAENSSKTRILSNLIRNLDGVAIASAPLGGGANDTIDNLIADNVIDNCYGGIALGAVSSPPARDRRCEVLNNKIIGGARSTSSGITLSQYVEDCRIMGGTISKMQGHGINISTVGGDRLMIRDVLIHDVGTAGTWAGIAYNPQGGAKIDDLVIDSVTVRDDQITKTTSYGVLFVSFSPIPARLTLTNNRFLTLAVGGISWPAGSNLGASPENVIRNNYDGSANVWDDPGGADVASANTITITSRYHRVTGNTLIFAIQRAAGMTDSIIYLEMVGGAALSAGGPPGIAIAMSKTVTAGQLVILRYDTVTGLWSPS